MHYFLTDVFQDLSINSPNIPNLSLADTKNFGYL